ncbi:MAG: hypothetical protein ACI8RD_003097 [Bacillariaceae sp.]|jgi:hypothetical protein
MTTIAETTKTQAIIKASEHKEALSNKANCESKETNHLHYAGIKELKSAE